MSDFNKNSPNLPSNQPFNVTPRRGVKKHSWWMVGHSHSSRKSDKR
jgi:hypothetical protein